MRYNPIERRRRAAQRASHHFTRAAAALTESPINAGAVAFALLEASMGLVSLAECDDDACTGQAKAIAHIRAAARLEHGDR